MDRLSALGVITGKTVPDKDRIDKLYKDLTSVFESPDVIKEDIVRIMQDYLPNFEHLETGRSLDSRM